jgi:predicted dehydrogenase
MAEPVAIGIVGFGIMGERLLRAAIGHEAVRLAGVHDPSPQAAGRLQAIPGAPALLGSVEEVIRHSDLVYIATPPGLHLPIAEQAVAAGRAIFLEKPLSNDTPAARDFVQRAEAEGWRAAVNFPMASSPAVAQLQQWRDAGATGTPQALEIEVAFARWPRGWQQDAASWLAKRQEGGFCREVVSHFLFLTGRQMGQLLLEEADVTWGEGDACESAVRARLLAGGLEVTLRGGVGTTDRDDTNSWTLTGPAGSIRLRDWSFAERLVEGSWQPAPDAIPNEKMRPMVLKGQLDKAAAMTRGEAHSLATLREALEVQVTVEGILAAG